MRRSSTELPTADDLTWWRATLAPLDRVELGRIEARVRVRRLAIGDAYLQVGDPAIDCGLIHDGLVRESFLFADGTERTRAFGGPGDFAGSLSDLLRGGAARCAVVACAPTTVLTVPWSAIEAAVATSPAWRALLATVTERLYLAKAEREYELLGLDAAARYARFRDRFGHLDGVIAQRHVASYLGITPEHLSRLRAKLGVQRRRTIASAPTKPPRKASQRPA